MISITEQQISGLVLAENAIVAFKDLLLEYNFCSGTFVNLVM